MGIDQSGVCVVRERASCDNRARNGHPNSVDRCNPDNCAGNRYTRCSHSHSHSHSHCIARGNGDQSACGCRSNAGACRPFCANQAQCMGNHRRA